MPIEIIKNLAECNYQKLQNIYSISAIRLIETITYDRAVNITQNIGKLL